MAHRKRRRNPGPLGLLQTLATSWWPWMIAGGVGAVYLVERIRRSDAQTDADRKTMENIIHPNLPGPGQPGFDPAKYYGSN